MNKIEELKERWEKASRIKYAYNLLSWDQEVYMPKGAGEERAKTLASLAVLYHQKVLDVNKDGFLDELYKSRGEFEKEERACIEESKRDYDKESCLPEKFVGEFSELASKSFEAWQEARKKDDEKIFLPFVEKMFEMSRQKANYLNSTINPYDTLLDMHEPGLTANSLDVLFSELKDFLVDLLGKIATDQPSIPTFSVDNQWELSKYLSDLILDQSVSRLDISTHPFTATIHPNDVRITTRFKEDDWTDAYSSTIHEAGHALFELQLNEDWKHTPLANTDGILGLHESQSRLWENHVGKSRAFLSFIEPLLNEKLGLKDDLNKIWGSVNRISPGLIRVEADEITYHLHIIIRYEIEKSLIAGEIEFKDIETVWNQKYKEYLGVEVSKPSQGWLQDIHWSHGYIGYFPTYTIGTIIAAQIWGTIERDLGNSEEWLAKGDLSELREWLKTNIHHKARVIPSMDIVKQVTGEDLSVQPLKKYLEDKFLK
jgi:carboxypeptidase Taq